MSGETETNQWRTATDAIEALVIEHWSYQELADDLSVEAGRRISKQSVHHWMKKNHVPLKWVRPVCRLAKRDGIKWITPKLLLSGERWRAAPVLTQADA